MKPLFIVVPEQGAGEEYKDNLRQLIIRALGHRHNEDEEIT